MSVRPCSSSAVPVSSRKECPRVSVPWIKAQGIFCQLANALPIACDERLLGFVEQTIDLPLNTFTDHNGAIIALRMRLVKVNRLRAKQ